MRPPGEFVAPQQAVWQFGLTATQFSGSSTAGQCVQTSRLRESRVHLELTQGIDVRMSVYFASFSCTVNWCMLFV